MPTALILALQPTEAARVPANLSRSLHAWFLGQVARSDPTLAERLHQENTLRPFTITNLRELSGTTATLKVSPEQTYTLRLTLFDPALEALVREWTSTTLGTTTLNESTWQFTACTSDPAADPWAGQQHFDEMAAAVLLSPHNPSTRWEFEFATPVTFRQRGLNQPFPTPDLVFGSLLERWNAFGPLPFPDEVREFVSSAVAVSRFDLRSVAVPIKGNAVHIGAVGRCTYTAVERGDRYLLACLHILAQFAFYSGIGSGAARGAGQARMR